MSAKDMMMPQEWVDEEKLTQEEIDTITGWLDEDVQGSELLGLTGKQIAERLFMFLDRHGLPPWHPVVEYFRWYAIAKEGTNSPGLASIKVSDIKRPDCKNLLDIPYVVCHYRVVDDKGRTLQDYTPLCMIVPEFMVTWNLQTYLPCNGCLAIHSPINRKRYTNILPESILTRACGKGILTDHVCVKLTYVDDGYSLVMDRNCRLRQPKNYATIPEGTLPKRIHMQGLQWWLRRFHECLPDFDSMTEAESSKVAHIMETCCRRLKTVKETQEGRQRNDS